MDFILNQYNNHYLNSDEGEIPLTEAVLRHVLDILLYKTRFIDSNSRKIRQRLNNGNYHLRKSNVYKINSRGIEYLNAIQKVVDAENTVTANIGKINDYCQLIDILSDFKTDHEKTTLYNRFANMLISYEDVMKGMHKLDNDLDELVNDLNFNHGSKAAKHLQEMLNQKAIPAFQKLLSKASKVQKLSNSKNFMARVAHSQQGIDDLDPAHAINDDHAITQRFRQTEAYTKRQMDRLTQSFNPSTSAIDASFDSVYLLFNTILKAIQLLSLEYENITNQSINIKSLTHKIDKLMINYRSLKIPAQIIRHFPQDRFLDDKNDLLEASILGPVEYEVNMHVKKIATESDNPQIANDEEKNFGSEIALLEFKKLVMINEYQAVIDHDLEFSNKVARDEVIRLYSAAEYDHYDSFTPFGRSVVSVNLIKQTGPIKVHCKGENFSAFLPHGLKINFYQGNKTHD